MSDYLFRMVERAAGKGVGSAPQLSREFHWPVATEAPEPSIVPIRPHARDQAMNSTLEKPFFPPELHGSFSPSPPAALRTSRPDGIRREKNFGAAAVLGESTSVEPVTRVPTVLADEHHPLVSREDEPPVSSGNPSFPSEIATHTANRTEEIRGMEIQNSNRDPETSMPHSKETAEGLAKSNSSSPPVQPKVQIYHPVPVPVASASVPAVAQASDTLPARPSAPSTNPAAKGAREKPEPAVEVKIGRVEVRFDAPAAARPSRPSRPSGFAEFAPLRQYQTQPWPSGNR